MRIYTKSKIFKDKELHQINIFVPLQTKDKPLGLTPRSPFIFLHQP